MDSTLNRRPSETDIINDGCDLVCVKLMCNVTVAIQANTTDGWTRSSILSIYYIDMTMTCHVDLARVAKAPARQVDAAIKKSG